MKTKISNALLVIGLLIILVTLALFPVVPDGPTASTPTTTVLFVFPTITTGPPLPARAQAATAQAREQAAATATWETFYGYGD